MNDELAQIIYKARIEQGMTQDQYGQKYDVTGPAVFKFEKGYIRPSLKLWLEMASDAGLEERHAVLLWLRSKLDEQYQQYVDVTSKRKPAKKGETAYKGFTDRDSLREAALKDKGIKKGFRDVLSDDEIWNDFKPTGSEILLVRENFCALDAKKAKAEDYAEALRIVRHFCHSF